MNAATTAPLYDRATAGEAEAQFQLGRELVAQNQLTRARRWLQAAARQQHAAALNELGLMTLYGAGTEANVATAAQWFQQAEAQGSAEASYQLAMMAWCEAGVPFDLARIEARIVQAGQRGYPLALRALALVYRRMAEADAALHAIADACALRAAAAGDGISAFLLGWRWLAQPDRTNHALRLLRAARALGVTRAGHHLAGLGADGDATVDAPAPLPVLPPVTLSVATTGARRQWLDAPLVETIADVLSPEECEFAIALGEPFLERSLGYADTPTPVRMVSDLRSSSGMTYLPGREDFALRWLQWRMAALVGVPLQQIEYLALLRYLPGEQFRPHRDYLPPGVNGNLPQPNQPGQRVHTLFCNLNDVAEGGETEFPLQGARITPVRGQVVHFLNLHADGRPDERSLHAGLPVLQGEKWLATLWTRQRRCREF